MTILEKTHLGFQFWNEETMNQREKYSKQGQTGSWRGILCEGDITNDETQTGEGRSAASFVTSLSRRERGPRNTGPLWPLFPLHCHPAGSRRSLLQSDHFMSGQQSKQTGSI